MEVETVTNSRVEENPSKMVLSTLNDSELSLILEKLESWLDHDCRKSCSEVCKQWYGVEALTRSTLRIKHLEHLHQILPRFPNITSFQVHHPLCDSQLQFVSQSCSKIQRLWLRLERSSSTDTTPDTLGDDGVSAIAQACHDLTHVYLSGRKGVGDASLTALVQSCPKLAHLNLEGCVRITAEPLEAMGSDSFVAPLEYLELSGCREITELGLKTVLQSCPKLVHLNLAGCVAITAKSLEVVGFDSCVAPLEYLDLKHCCRITDLGLKALVKGPVAHTLRSLFLSGCHNIRNGGLSYLKDMHCLEELRIANCGPWITDIGGVEVSKVRTLRRVSFSGLSNISDVTIYAVTENCPYLVDVDLSGCLLVSKLCIFRCYKQWRLNAKVNEEQKGGVVTTFQTRHK